MSALTCAELVELVTAHLEHALAPDVEADFLAHLADCEGCEQYLDQFRDTIRRLGALPEAALPDAARDRLLAAFRDWRAPEGAGDRRSHPSGS